MYSNIRTSIYGVITQKRLSQLGTGQANYSSQSTPKKKCTELLKYAQEGV